jgi:hypothetical protein
MTVPQTIARQSIALIALLRGKGSRWPRADAMGRVSVGGSWSIEGQGGMNLADVLGERVTVLFCRYRLWRVGCLKCMQGRFGLLKWGKECGFGGLFGLP